MTQCHAHRAALADLDAMTYVVIRPAPAADDTDHAATFAVEAAAHGMSKAAAAYALRKVADQFDADAAAVGDQPLDADAIAEADARNAPRRATSTTLPARPAGLAELLDHVAANLDDDRAAPVLSTLAEALLDEERAPTPVAAYGAARIVLAEHARQLSAMLRAAAHARCDCCLDQVARLDEYAGQLAPHLAPPAVDDEHQAAEPAPRFPQLAVPCPRCEAPAGQLCTSHSGTRTRTGDTHQARTAAHRATTAAGR